MGYSLRITFEATVEDLVEAHLRLARGLKTVRRHRTRLVWSAAVASSLAFLAFAVIGRTTWSSLLTVGLAAVGLGVVVGFAYRWFYDRTVNRRARRIIE